MNGIASAVLFGIVASPAKATDPSAENADAPPPRPVVYVTTSDMIRAKIDADAALRERWRRGSALLGVGIVTTIGAGVMLVAGGIMAAGDSYDWCGTSSWTQDGHTTTMHEPCPNGEIGGASIGLIAGSFAVASAGATMMGFGIRDRVIAKRDARRRLSIAAAPTRDGATFAFTLRF